VGTRRRRRGRGIESGREIKIGEGIRRGGRERGGGGGERGSEERVRASAQASERKSVAHSRETWRTRPKRSPNCSRKARSIPIFNVTVDEGQLLQAPCACASA
jgi:hypothetical protein